MVIQQGTTSQTIEIFIADSASSPVGMGKIGLTNATAGLKVYYQRRGAAPVQITLAALTTITDAYASGGFLQIDGTNQPGRYRLDLPNAVLASGVVRATVTVTGAGTIDDEVALIELTSYDPYAVDKTGFALSAAGIQAIWDALTSALTTAGSVGKRVTDNLDVVLSTRLSSAGYTSPDNASITAIKAKTDSLTFTTPLKVDTDTFGRVGAPVGATISADIAAVKTDTAAVKAKTDNLPAVAAGASGGLPTVDAANGVKVSVGTGTGQLSVATGKVAATLVGDPGYYPAGDAPV